MSNKRDFQNDRPPIVLMTDFGTKDHYVGVMKGVISKIAPCARVIDLTHEVPPQSISAGALILRESWSYFPEASIFVAVVDPGVGTQRRAIVVETRAGSIFIGPDNGVLWLAAEEAGFRTAYELTNSRYQLTKVSATFHGRDVFAPAAAHIWNGVRCSEFGRQVDEPIRFEIPKPQQSGKTLHGVIIYVDHFGNLISNISRQRFDEFVSHFPGGELLIKIGEIARIPLRRTYGDVGEGEELALFDSLDLLEVAVRNGNAAERFDLGVGARVEVIIDGA